jgi:hypothetical protein
MTTTTERPHGECYTRAELEAGSGFYSDGRWTVIYRRPDGWFVTAETSDRPGSELELVGGGSTTPDRKPQIRWC